MEFKTIYNRPRTEPAPAGEKLVPEYEMQVGECGHKHLIQKTALRDIYTPIQESLEESKIENILRRAAGGDATALAVHNGTYMDLRGAPTSLAEAQAAIIAAENEWLKLPLEIRKAFDHSFEKYINDAGTEEWHKVFTDYEEKRKAIKMPKVNPNLVEEGKTEDNKE